MITALAPGFTGNPLDRADHVREDRAAFAALLGDRDSRLLQLNGLEPILDDEATLRWGSLADVSDDADLALLGLIEGRPHFVTLGAVESGFSRSAALFRMLEAMPGDQAAIYATARSLVDWHNRHRFCANCGSDTRPERAGWSRRCGGCSAQHFPRTDPVVIMLAEHDGRVLLGRQPQFPANRYSALAGFLEIGESIEDAVRRELREEAGIETSTVRYIASQPWPFPSSLMIACVAKAESDAITLDTNELEDAFWCSREEVVAALQGAPDARFLPPPPYAIAHTLLLRWMAEP